MTETLPLPEPASAGRKFTEIQGELTALVNNPDSAKERELRMERARVINDAKSIGVDYGILGTIKRQMLDIETHNPSIAVSGQLINELDTDRLEDEARGLVGWDDRFEGLIEEYKQGALRNLTLAFLKKSEAPQRDIDRLQREIDLLNWGAPPSIIATMAIQPGEIDRSTGIDTRVLARQIAEAQGILNPDAYLEEARQGEEHLRTAVRIVPGQEPRFWIALTDKQKEEWIVRSTLWIIAYKKAASISTEELYMKEMQDMAVDMNKRAHKILFGAIDRESGKIEFEGMDGVLAAAGIYTTIIGDPKFLGYKGRNDLSLKQVFCEVLSSKKLRKELIDDFGQEAVDSLQAEEDRLYETCPDSMYPHKTDPKEGGWGTSINAEGFRALRRAIRFWLVTKGRDLLISDEDVRKGDLFKDKEKFLETLKVRAREAEVVGWNYIFSTGLLESFDSRDYRPAGTKRHGPSGFWSLALWTPMHLQERFEAKVFRGNNSLDAEPKEEWAGSLGTWAINNFNKGNWQTRKPDGSIVIDVPKILPNTLFRGALFNKYLHQTGRVGDDKPGDKLIRDDKPSLFDLFNAVGNEALFETDSTSSRKLQTIIDWSDVPDTPFVNYIWDEIRWADVIQTVFKKGSESKVNTGDLSEAVRNLRLSYQVRRNLLIAFFGANPSTSELKYMGGPTKWSGLISGISKTAPNYFTK